MQAVRTVQTSRMLAAPAVPLRAGRALVQVVECKALTRRAGLQKRHQRIRRKMTGTTERPRLAVFRSHNHIHAQVIDDSVGHTLAAASTLQKDVMQGVEGTATCDAASAVGKKLAELCASKNISKVCFDRGGFAYHGRVKAVADAAREAGLEF